jgi:double-stranded uracil-DNA glycosylase
MFKEGLPPIINEETEILILGSLPGDISINKQQYYANSNNDFWKIMQTILNETIPPDYTSKIKILHKHHIGLWDVYHSCNRAGSMDKNIIDKEINDFNLLKEKFPKIKLICFNGKEAGLSEQTLQNNGFRTKILPSSSGANRRNQNQRINEWRTILK